MAHAFSPIPAKSAFGNITQSDYASDYIQNKIAKLAYCNDVRNANCKKKFSQSELLLFNKGRLLNSYAFCVGTSLINEANLVAGLYTESDLSGVAVICDILGDACITPTAICPNEVPFYEHYLIDPDGQLFGNTPCGMTNFTKYMGVPVVSILGPPTDLHAVGGAKSVLLSWTAPMTSDNSTITDYRIYWILVDDDHSSAFSDVVSDAVGWDSISVETMDSMYNVTGLRDGKTYLFKIEAVGLLIEKSKSKGSFSPTPISAKTLSLPDELTDLMIEETLTSVDGVGQVKLSWTDPSDSTITSYSIRYSNSNASSFNSNNGVPSWTTTSTAKSTTNSITLTGLSLTATAYQFYVAAVNSVGTGPYTTQDTYTLHKFTTTGSRTRSNPGNNYASYVFNPTTSNNVGTFKCNRDIVINFLIVGSGTSGQVNNQGCTSSGGGSGGIMQGSLLLPANNVINIHVGIGGGSNQLVSTRSNILPSSTGFAPGYSGMPSSITINGGTIMAGYCDANSVAPYSNTIDGFTDLSPNIYCDASGLGCTQGTSSSGAGATGVSGETIYLYDNLVNIMCSSSGGGGAGGPSTGPIYYGGLGGPGAGQGGDNGRDGTNGVNYGSGGGGGGSISGGNNGAYGAGADGVVIIYFKYPLDSSINDRNIVNPDAPSAPTGLLASAGDTSVMLSWPGPSTNDYIIYYSEKNYFWPVQKQNVLNDTSFNVQGLINGTLYYFKITAENSFGEGYPSNVVTATPSAPPVGKPTGLNASIVGSDVHLSWIAPSFTGGIGLTIMLYVVRYSLSINGPWTLMSDANIVTTNTNISLSLLSSNMLYYFEVAAVNSVPIAGDYSDSTSCMITPGTPTGLLVSANAVQISLSWNPPIGDNITYIVQYGTDNNTNGIYNTIYGNTSSTYLNINNLTTGSLYSFQVAAINSAGTQGSFCDPSPQVNAPDCPRAIVLPFGGSIPAGTPHLSLPWSAPLLYVDTITGYAFKYPNGFVEQITNADIVPDGDYLSYTIDCYNAGLTDANLANYERTYNIYIAAMCNNNTEIGSLVSNISNWGIYISAPI